MADDETLREYQAAYRQVELDRSQRAFHAHVLAFAAVNGLMIIMNFMYLSEVIWFIYPLFGWGMGVAMHYLLEVRELESDLAAKEAQAEALARQAH